MKTTAFLTQSHLIDCPLLVCSLWGFKFCKNQNNTKTTHKKNTQTYCDSWLWMQHIYRFTGSFSGALPGFFFHGAEAVKKQTESVSEAQSKHHRSNSSVLPMQVASTAAPFSRWTRAHKHNTAQNTWSYMTSPKSQQPTGFTTYSFFS